MQTDNFNTEIIHPIQNQHSLTKQNKYIQTLVSLQ